MKCAVIACVDISPAIAATLVSAAETPATFSAILRAPDSEGRPLERLQKGVQWASENKCDWIFVLGAPQALHPKIFETASPFLAEHDAVFGLLVTADEKGAHVVFPQLIDPESCLDLIIHPASKGCEPCFFLNLSKADIVRNQKPGTSLLDLILNLWDAARCIKPRFPLTISTKVFEYDAADINAALQPRFLEKRIYFGDPSIQARYNLNFEKAWAFYHENQLDTFAPMLVPNFLKSLPYYGVCPFETVNNRLIGLVNWADDVVAGTILWTGQYEPMTARLWQNLSIANTGAVLDIGAYDGFYALLAGMVNFSNTVIGFEPVPENYARCMLNLQTNNLGNVRFSIEALGDKPGLTEINISAGHGFLSTGAQVSDVITRTVRLKYPAVLTTIDTVAKTLNMPLRLIKCDTEGFEPQVLRGGRETIARDKPDIIMEVTQDGSAMDETAAWLKGLGYNFYVIEEAAMKLTPVDTLRVIQDMNKLNRLISVMKQG